MKQSIIETKKSEQIKEALAVAQEDLQKTDHDVIGVIPAQPGWFVLVEIKNVIPDFRTTPVLGWIVIQESTGIETRPLTVNGMAGDARYIQLPGGRIEDVGNAVFDNQNDLVKSIQEKQNSTH